MLRIDTREQTSPDVNTSEPDWYFDHDAASAESLAVLLREHSVDHRCIDRLTAWTGEPSVGGRQYSVLGWTSASILRFALSHRLDELNPVAAFRLLDQPEIERLVRSGQNYVVLRACGDFESGCAEELAGSISGLDLDLWIGSSAAEMADAVAISFDTYLRRFASTGVAA